MSTKEHGKLDLGSEPSGLTEDEEEVNRRRMGHINDRAQRDVRQIGHSEDDETSTCESESDSETSYKHESYIFARTEWKGEKKPEDTHHENWFLLDRSRRFHFKYHFRRHKRRATQCAFAFRDLVVGLPWHHIRIAFIFLLFVGSMLLFMSVEAPDDSPPTRLAAVSLAQPIYRVLDEDEPLDTIRVNLAIQEIRNVSALTSWSTNTSVSVAFQASTSANVSDATATWDLLDSWKLAARADESQSDFVYFYLNDTHHERYETFRVVVTTDAVSPLGLRLDVMQLSWLARYEVVIGFVLLVMVYALIIFEWVHRTVAALVGSFWGIALLSFVIERPSFYEVITWIDYDTIGLLFGMMILVGIFSTTGFFEWSAVQAYKLSKGNIWHLVIMLCGFTAVASMFLDNVTTILLVTPVTLRLCRVLDLDPVPVVLTEVIFSNIGGTATGIGDPPNILIISNSQIKDSGLVDFSSFTLHVAPGAILAMITTYFLVAFVYKKRICRRAPVDPLRKEIEIWKKTLHTHTMMAKADAPDADNRVQHKLVLHINQLETRLSEKLASLAALEAVLDGNNDSTDAATTTATGSNGHLPGAGVRDVRGKQKMDDDDDDDDHEAGAYNGDNNGLGKESEADEEDVLDGSQRYAEGLEAGRQVPAAAADAAPASTKVGTIDVAALERKYMISDVTLFIKSCCVLVVVILLFFLHSFLTEIKLSLPWIAILGALVLLVLSGTDNFHEILEKVETSTLLFFAGLFVMVRCVEELGVTVWIANTTSDVIDLLPEGRLRLAFAVFLIIWVCAVVSMFIDNIPFTTTMIPVVVKLSQGTLALPLQPLTWAMAFGACLGGNGTLIGASANVVAAGITEQYGRPISFNYFFKMGFPCMLVSTATATAYLLVTHVLLGWY